jgi:hypothetical protein
MIAPEYSGRANVVGLLAIFLHRFGIILPPAPGRARIYEGILP